MSRVLVVLSGHTEQVLPLLRAARARWSSDAITVVLRASQGEAFGALLQGVTVLADKPTGGRVAFVRALRREVFDQGIVAWTGAFNFWPSKLAFALARVRTRELFTERGTQPWRLATIAKHLTWRAKSPVHSTAGAPPGVPWPLAIILVVLRATLGRVVGPLLVGARALLRHAAP